jgi:hypothetical protein
MTALRPWSNRKSYAPSAVPSLLDSLLDAAEAITDRPRASLLDELQVAAIERLTVTVETRLAAPAVQTVPVIEEIVMVGFQLLDWTLILIPCPACQCYPCQPGHVNGHTEEWIASAGDLVTVRAH